MTPKEQRRIMKDILDSVGKSCLEATEKMPPSWNGLELRAYLASKFQEAAWGMDRAREREFRQDCLTLNI